MRSVLILVAIFLIFSFIHYAAKKKKPFKRAFLSMLVGVLTLGVVNLISTLTTVYVPVTELSLTVSAAGGIPGVALMVLLSAF
ncbi:MAG: pro-sigmaK processing inhibitor BofA family protein [Ruminococcus sp.]|nr:pro-sigmaK processing inhibitor BofA family protein [Ruminococcus sp.]MBQ9515026.1 pro-sigmaK processing inhibitor BofA family protein [Ruminococcus sp.]